MLTSIRFKWTSLAQQLPPPANDKEKFDFLLLPIMLNSIVVWNSSDLTIKHSKAQ